MLSVSLKRAKVVMATHADASAKTALFLPQPMVQRKSPAKYEKPI